jgi:type II secretory pathway pseudopilin PulG
VSGDRRPRRQRRSDAGESLVELLITVVILGTSVVGVLGAVATAVGASSFDKRQVQAQALLRTWGEQIAAVDDAGYGDCLSASEVAAATPASVPAEFTARVSRVTYWDGSAFAAGCTADPGLRLVRLELTAVDSLLHPGSTQTLDVVVRRPCTAC